MVNETWIKQKIIQLETDYSNGQWSEIRKQQIIYLKTLCCTGSFARVSPESINEKLVLIFHGF